MIEFEDVLELNTCYATCNVLKDACKSHKYNFKKKVARLKYNMEYDLLKRQTNDRII